MRYFSYYKDKSIVNFSNSILKKYNCKTFHNSIKEIDDLLAKHDKIALFLFDGMGKSISEKLLKEDSYLMKNVFTTISSTFPPTTAASTNAFKSAKFPAETGWLGWTFYNKEKNKVVEMFSHKNYLTHEKEFDYDYNKFNYETIFEMIMRNNKEVYVYENYPKAIGYENGFIDIDDMFNKTHNILQNHCKTLIYSYFLDPDHQLHIDGSNAKSVKKIVNDINKKVEKFAKENPDTLVLVFADHSHILSEPIFFDELNELNNIVKNVYAIEARAAAFFVKEGQNESFEKYYEENLKNYYDILTKDEVINSELFGPTNDTKFLDELMGDYLLIAIGNKSFDMDHKEPMKSHHAGGTIEENLINIYALNK